MGIWDAKEEAEAAKERSMRRREALRPETGGKSGRHGRRKQKISAVKELRRRGCEYRRELNARLDKGQNGLLLAVREEIWCL